MEELKTEIGSEQIEKKKLWNKDFILLLQGCVVSTIGDMMYSVAIGYWALWALCLPFLCLLPWCFRLYRAVL